MHHHFHHRLRTQRRPSFDGSEKVRRELPLEAGALLDLQTDFAMVYVTPLSRNEKPYLEVFGEHPLPEIDLRVDEASKTTLLRIQGLGRGLEERLTRGRAWEGRFWEKLRWKKHFQVQLILHVPENLRARIRPSAAYVHVEQLRECELDIHADAGALILDDVSGKLTLQTEAGRIDGTALAGSISATTSAGAIRLELLDLDPGRHRVRTNMGAAIIALARGLPAQVETRTSMGSSRVDFPSLRGADAVLDVEADLGAIRIFESRRAWAPPTRKQEAAGAPYRASAPPSEGSDPEVDNDTVEKILAKVADGSLSPNDARELLRSLGWT